MFCEDHLPTTSTELPSKHPLPGNELDPENNEDHCCPDSFITRPPDTPPLHRLHSSDPSPCVSRTRGSTLTTHHGPKSTVYTDPFTYTLLCLHLIYSLTSLSLTGVDFC